jgi:hypothetical protein
MARGRQQKWICKDCKSEFSVQGKAPKFCCACGSENIGRAPSFELLSNFEEKRKSLDDVCRELNPVFAKYVALKEQYDRIMNYWKQQRKRGYISLEEYRELAEAFDGAKPEAPESSDSSGS